MAAITLTVNGRQQSVDVAPQMPLLWVLRDTLGMTGTKFGCGMGLCGACTVHIDGQALRSCSTPISKVAGKRVTTIEGLPADGSHPVQKAWLEVDEARNRDAADGDQDGRDIQVNVGFGPQPPPREQ